MNNQVKTVKIVIHCIMIIICLVTVYPMISVVNVALKTHEEFLKFPTNFVMHPILNNFITAWKEGDMGTNFKNSIFLSGLAPLGICLFSTMAAFPISRRHIKAANFLYLLFIIATFIPTSYVTQIYLMRNLHLMNHLYGVLIFYIANTALPIIIIVGFIKSLPKELDEAAVIDGCGYLMYIFKVIIPLSKPVLATVVILSIISTWNDFITPYLYLSDKAQRTLASGLYLFVGTYSVDYTVMCAGVILVATPIIIAYIFLQRYIISGMSAGAIKG